MGLYKFTHIPFRLCGVPSSFQRLTEECSSAPPTLMMYLSTHLQQHWLYLREILQRLHAAGLLLCGSKCHLGMSKVVYLGHMFWDKRMAPMTIKLQQCGTRAHLPMWVTWVGLAWYYCLYVHSFANTAAPLYQLTHKNTPFHWDN